jgi:hypothetical protein
MPQESDPHFVHPRETLEILSEPPAPGRRIQAMIIDGITWPITMFVLWLLAAEKRVPDRAPTCARSDP